MFKAVQQDRRVGQGGKAIMTFRGVVIAEALKDPTVVNRLSVYRVRITDEGVPIDYEGHTGRWHLYWIGADQETISFIQRETKPGWYAHFWEGDRLLVIYDDAAFELSRDNRPSWRPAIEHGAKQGIPRGELDFVTED
jgi:hypothetical protein